MIDLINTRFRGRAVSLHEVLNLINGSASTSGSSTTGYKKYTETISSWTADGTLFYKDITHSLESEDVVTSFRFADNSVFVEPEKMQVRSHNLIRVWFAGNTRNIKVVVIR